MSDNQNQNSDRWQALDAIKTLGLLGAFSAHIVIWWFGKNLDPASGAVFFNLNGIPNWLIVMYIIVVHFILISAGAALYFYLRRKPSLEKISLRIALLILLGVLFGLNLQPFFVFWNVFLLYAFSLLIIFIIDHYGNEKIIFYVTFCALVVTPFLRLFLNNIAPGNYWSAILVGDLQGRISFYPFFPWFFLIGAGFFTSYFYSKHQSKHLLTYGICGGIVTLLAAFPFLKPLDFSNIFGVTSQIPLSYIIFIFGFFVFLISLLELIFKKITLSKYNPAIAIGRHILPVYLITVVITLPLTNILKNSAKYGKSIYIFLGLEFITFLIAYLSGAILTYRSGNSTERPN
ncbi:MAG: hypothetical protein V1484_00625 [bacterium]